MYISKGAYPELQSISLCNSEDFALGQQEASPLWEVTLFPLHPFYQSLLSHGLQTELNTGCIVSKARSNANDYGGLIQSMKLKLLCTSVKTALSSKLKKKKSKFAEYACQCFYSRFCSPPLPPPCTHSSHAIEKSKQLDIKPILVFFMNLFLSWRAISESWREGFCSSWYVMFSQIYLRSRKRKWGGPKSWISEMAPPLSLQGCAEQNPPLWAVLSCRTLCKWAWSTLGKQGWLVNSISLHQWAEKALDNMLWVVDPFDCIVAKWELFCNIDS